MRILSVSDMNKSGISNTGYKRNLTYNNQTKSNLYKSDNVYTRLADASTRDIRIFNELKLMGLI